MLKENIEKNINWRDDFTVFPDSFFELCGYTAFRASVSGGGERLLIHSDDRDLPGRTYKGMQWRVEPDKLTQLFEGCDVLFNYEKLSGGERIRIREKGE